MQQDKKRPKWFYVAACAISLGGLAAVTLVPALRGPVEFSPQLCLDYLGFLAVTWAAAFAADNLGELRAARLADFEPLIDVGISRRLDNGEHQIVISVRNLGRGHAAGLHVSLYQQEVDQSNWVEDRLLDIPELVAPGEVLAPVHRKDEWVRYDVQQSDCDLIIEGSYRTPLGESRQIQRAFKLGATGADVSEVPPPKRGG